MLSLYAHAEQRHLRIISLTPATTEILYALGLGNEIVGVSSFCNYPKEAQSKEKVGTFSQVNIEKIISLKPDIIFCAGLEQAPIISELRNLKLKVFVCDPSNFEELIASITEIAKITDKDKEGQDLVKQIRVGLDSIKNRVDAIPLSNRPKVFIEIWHDPLMSVGKGSLVDNLITLAGGINVSGNMNRPYSLFSPEQVLKLNPDVIILAYMTNESPANILFHRLGWSDINAVKNNRVFNDINPDILLRPSPRLIEGLKEIYKRLYK